MNKDKITRGKPRRISVSMRITKRMSEFLNENNYSPTGIFMEAVKDLGFKE